MSSPTTSPAPVRVLIDTNVALDWLLDRKPWSDEAKPLWDARSAGRVVCYLPASVLTDIFYVVRRQTDIPTAFSALDQAFAAFGLFVVDTPLLLQRVHCLVTTLRTMYRLLVQLMPRWI